MYLKYLKSKADLLLAICALTVLLPLLLLLALVNALHFRGNPFFCQKRTGQHALLFTIIKFKSMSATANNTFVITAWGKFLRRTGLDELPQLLNIMKGEMSLVGPRPLLPEYLSLYSSFARQRHAIKPGITGLAQIHGGNSLDWVKRFEYDVYYVKHASFCLDCRIIFRTFHYIFFNKSRQDIGPLTSNQI